MGSTGPVDPCWYSTEPLFDLSRVAITFAVSLTIACGRVGNVAYGEAVQRFWVAVRRCRDEGRCLCGRLVRQRCSLGWRWSSPGAQPSPGPRHLDL